jgi:hypothetical protein
VPEPPFTQLPDHISLSLDEVAIVLAVLDSAQLTAETKTERENARRAIRIITTKLWPELGRLLEDDEE